MKITTFFLRGGYRDNIKVTASIIKGIKKDNTFDKQMKQYRFISECSAKHIYYDYYFDGEDGDLVEIYEKSEYIQNVKYYKVLYGELKEINVGYIVKYFKDVKYAE
jgi:hypothetical protein